MATETVSPATAAQKMSRYRSVRRAQEQQTQQQQQQQPQSPPAIPEHPPARDMEAHKDAQISRSMSRYHRRPPAAHATTPALPSVRSNTLPAQQTPPVTQPSTSRIRAASSPQYAANTAQHRPRTAKQQAQTSASASNQSRSPRADDSARQLMQKERERQRLLKEKYEAEARAQREAKQAELDRLERLRQEEEEAALQQAQREAEEVEAIRRQQEQQKAEQERGKRLRKAETQKVLQQREEEARQAKRDESERRARREDERARRAPSSSPPVSPPRQHANHGLFKRRKDDGLTPEDAVEARAPRISLHLEDRESETIRPGGGGAVLGIDAPTSAVNAGDRVSLLLLAVWNVLIQRLACNRCLWREAHSSACYPNDHPTRPNQNSCNHLDGADRRQDCGDAGAVYQS
jgi:hypothetical protein